MLLQALHVEIEMKNLNLQVTLLLSAKRCGDAVPTRSQTTTPVLAGLLLISSHL